jgi:hypothetical protein
VIVNSSYYLDTILLMVASQTIFNHGIPIEILFCGC